MTRASKVVFAVAMAAWLNAAAAQGPDRRVDSPPGAQLSYSSMICVWMIYQTAHKIGERCLHGTDAEFQNALDYAATRIETFLIKVSPSDAAQLQALKRPLAAVPMERMCQAAGSTDFYAKLRKRGAAQLVQGIDDWIAHPAESPDACL